MKFEAHVHVDASISVPGRLGHVHADCSTSIHESQVRTHGKLKVELGAFRRDQLSPSQSMPNFPCIHVSDSLAISFHRTVRVPDNGGSYPAPNSLGALPLLPVNKIKDKLPRNAIEKGGIVVPLYGTCVL
jgi:hypothetical protein